MKQFIIISILFCIFQLQGDEHQQEDLVLGLLNFLILKGVPEVQRSRIATDAKAYDAFEDMINAIKSDNSIFPKYKNLAIFYLNNISKVANQAEIFSLSSDAFDTASSQGLQNFLSARAVPKDDINNVVTAFDLGGAHEAINVAQSLGGLISILANEYFKLMGEGDLI